MKYLFLSLVCSFCLSAPVFADGDTDVQDIPVVSSSHEGSGYALRVKAVDVGEPVGAPLRVNVSLDCSNGSGGFKTIALVNNMSVCGYKSHKLLSDKGVLELKYSVASARDGIVSCDLSRSQSFDIKKECKRKRKKSY